ncbi:hypothetical protein B8A22_14805, partial [Staphylococcus aureus]
MKKNITNKIVLSTALLLLGTTSTQPPKAPISLLESIKTLIKNDTLVIAAGGGGIPVIREQHDGFKG